MITGDNQLTATAIAAEAGSMTSCGSEARRQAQADTRYQKGGALSAMTGDGTNDAPALAQGGRSVAMKRGNQSRANP